MIGGKAGGAGRPKNVLSEIHYCSCSYRHALLPDFMSPKILKVSRQLLLSKYGGKGRNCKTLTTEIPFSSHQSVPIIQIL